MKKRLLSGLCFMMAFLMLAGAVFKTTPETPAKDPMYWDKVEARKRCYEKTGHMFSTVFDLGMGRFAFERPTATGTQVCKTGPDGTMTYTRVKPHGKSKK